MVNMPQVSPFQLTLKADQDAYDWIIQELANQQPGNGEAVYAYDQASGAKIAAWYSLMLGAHIHSDLEAAMLGGVKAVLHHNHPSNGSFIDLDLETLVGLNPNYPNIGPMAEMWAHGNDGPHYRILLACPTFASAVIRADKFLNTKRAAWRTSLAGHEIFASGWRHLVCLCLEARGYVHYEYDATTFPNYRSRTYSYGATGQKLTMEQAYLVAVPEIIKQFGSQF
jgi:hypothetical protein